MAHILVHHKIEDYSKWEKSFNEHKSFRSENGSKGGKVFRNPDDPNDIFVLLEWESVDSIQKFSQSESLKEAMKNAGVVGKPDIYILEETAATSE